jgi:hypothetical protein
MIPEVKETQRSRQWQRKEELLDKEQQFSPKQGTVQYIGTPGRDGG